MTSEPRWELRHGDSLHLLRALPDESVDAVVTDPPYSSGGMVRSDRMAQPSAKYQRSEYARGQYPEFHGDNRDQRSFLAWCSLWLADAWRATRPGGVLVTFSDWRMLPTITDAVQAGGWVWRGIVPWHKPDARPQLGRFTQSCEFAVWGSRGPMPMDRGVPVLPGLMTAVPVRPDEREHVTEKPLEVMRGLVRIAAPAGIVLDPFAGSATTGAAALLEGRRFLGFELSDEYFAIGQRRLREVDAQAERGSERAGQTSLFAPTETP
jgi:site-specific DNA-methyltransferase (adenine-specific)